MANIHECDCGCDSCNDDTPTNYMFFNNLKAIKSVVDELVQMNPEEVDSILSNGHDWAGDHIATAKDDIQEVADFLNSQVRANLPHSQMHHPAVQRMVHTYESFISESKKK